MSEPPEIGAEFAGYRLESQIAKGGMAVVFLAEDARMGRRVALKVLAAELADDEGFRQRFLRESRIAAGIDHPNVIPIYDAGEADGVLYLAMRHVPDSDLRRLLRHEGTLEIDRAVAIAVQIAGALGAAHRRDLVHRDIKPANVLLIPRNSPYDVDHSYLADFGLAKHTGAGGDLTSTGQFLGTIKYTAPEQAEGKQVDGRADIYSLGCVLYECLTGAAPFERLQPIDVITAHVRTLAMPVGELRADCPPELAEVVGKALAKGPEDRYQTCDQLIAALRRAVPAGTSETTTTRVTPAGPPEPPEGPPPTDGEQTESEPGVGEPGRPARRRRGLIAGAVGVAGALLIAAVILLAGGGDDEKPGTAADLGLPGKAKAGSSAPAQTGDWREVRAAPTARQQTAATFCLGKIWVLGGLIGKDTATKATTKVEAYDPVTNAWIEEPDLPLPLHHAVAAAYKGKPVVIGGWTPEGANLTAKVSDRVFILDGSEWKELARLHHARAAGAAAAVGNALVVVGGQDAGNLVPQTEIFDGSKWNDTAEIPTPREHLAAATDGRYVYALGGRDVSPDKNSDAIERFDPATGTWAKLKPMPVPSGSLGAAFVRGNIVAVGGEGVTDVIDAVQAYNIGSGDWSELEPMRTPRHGVATVAAGDTLYAIDGALEPAHAASTSIAEALDFD